MYNQCVDCAVLELEIVVLTNCTMEIVIDSVLLQMCHSVSICLIRKQFMLKQRAFTFLFQY